MPDPVFTICEAGSTESSATEYDAGNPIPFLDTDKGIPSDILTIDIWNDREGVFGSDTAVAPRLYAINDDNINQVFDGTALNGFVSMLECRSCLASPGVPADMQSDWTPLSPLSHLVMGDLPAGCKRTVEIRLNPPIDAPTLTLKNFFIGVSA